MRKAAPVFPPKAAPLVLVLAAWAPELVGVKRRLRQAPPAFPVRFATVGVGLVEAAVGASLAIARERPAFVVLVGTAGVFKGQPWNPPQALAVLGLVLGTPEAATEAQVPPPMPQGMRTDARLTRSLCRSASLNVATVVCPLTITRGRKRAQALADHSQASLENLEAFAVATAAKRLKVPLVVVLGVANEVGQKGQAEWLQHGTAAANTAGVAVADWLASLKRPGL